MTRSGQAILLLAAMFLAGWAIARQPALEGRPPSGVKVTYQYDKRNPGYCSFRLTLRHDGKARPLFIAGRNRSGGLDVRFPSMEGMEEFEGVEGISDLVGGVECKGQAVIDASQWSADWIGAEQFVGTAWLEQVQRPKMTVRILDVADWKQKTDKKNRPLDRDWYQAKLTFEIQVGRDKVRLTAPADVRFRAPASKGAKYAMRFDTRFVLVGRKLGLTGADAGQIEARMVVEGFSTMTADSQEQLKKALEDSEIPTLD
jgi:hypothetical protein